MTMLELVRVVSDETGLTQVAVRATIESLLGAISGVMKDGASVTLQGFGTFSGKIKSERAYRNPANGEKIIVPEHNAPVFKASKELNEFLR